MWVTEGDKKIGAKALIIVWSEEVPVCFFNGPEFSFLKLCLLDYCFFKNLGDKAQQSN